MDPEEWLLVTDVDDTLCGDDAALRELSRWGGFRIVLNSSRPRASVVKTMEGFPPGLRVDGVITALGTEILLDAEDVVEWNFQFSGWDRTTLDRWMSECGFPAHPGEFQSRYKASFRVPRTRWREVIRAVTGLLPGSRVIASGETDFDVIPAGAGKDRAAVFVAERLGIRRDHLVVAGDSGNDFDMFNAAEKAIAVGNARPELIELADRHRTCFAKADRAAGILEGLRFWGVPVTPLE